ncbi:toxin HipA [Hydrogenovibrio sp. SC-1]|uniref:type II toxin-antitoxin system HipA family toxin n=1 Tax=Hydrogenovibrio sp. SC-1 TaxID=2065820 RepID=UPI000C7E2D4A|nr:type II toxin-antitoxin system HipA family toxin [Hydrogenovibrio sp. SC-1]PLA75030.1 toxin HipA [Hydrogenovibrio sp. SC-1]
MIQVYLYQILIGYLKLANRKIHFQYAEEWLKSDLDISPIIHSKTSFAISDRLSNDAFHGLPEFIADALPDKFGNKIIDTFFIQQGIARNDITPLDRLAYIGSKAMGALEFKRMSEHSNHDYSNILEISDLLVSARSAISGKLEEVSADLIEVGSFAGGARPKAIIMANHDFSEIRHSHSPYQKGFDHYLLKFDGVCENNPESDPQGYTNIEYVYHLLAVDAGIDMNPCFLLPEPNGNHHFITKRFDRDGDKKIHMQTLCGLIGLDFNDFQAGSYSDLFSVANVLNLAYGEKVELFRRMVFNVLSYNRDDHSKNFSFVFSENGRWSISPAYDITHAFNETNINAWTREHNLLINGKGVTIQLRDLIKEGAILALKPDDYALCIHQVINSLENWATLANKHGVKPDKIDQIGSHMKTAKTDLFFKLSKQEIESVSNGTAKELIEIILSDNVRLYR